MGGGWKGVFGRTTSSSPHLFGGMGRRGARDPEPPPRATGRQERLRSYPCRVRRIAAVARLVASVVLPVISASGRIHFSGFAYIFRFPAKLKCFVEIDVIGFYSSQHPLVCPVPTWIIFFPFFFYGKAVFVRIIFPRRFSALGKKCN